MYIYIYINIYLQKIFTKNMHLHIYQKLLHKASFQHDLARRTTTDNVLCVTTFDIAKNRKYDGYQRSFA